MKERLLESNNQLSNTMEERLFEANQLSQRMKENSNTMKENGNRMETNNKKSEVARLIFRSLFHESKNS